MAVSERRHNSSKHTLQQKELIPESIHFCLDEGKDGFVVKENTTLVKIYPSDITRHSTSQGESKFKFRNFVDYTWDVQYGTGRLISTHMSGKYIAYVVKVQGESKSTSSTVNHQGAVRVVDLDTNERVLMKGAKGLVKDVEFIHKPDDLIVGFIDEHGTFFVFKVFKDLKSGKLQHLPILTVGLDGAPNRLDMRRFIWCKYVPDDVNDIATPRDCAYHFAVLQNDVVYVANLVQLVQKFGEGNHVMKNLKGNYMTIDAHSGAVVDASFAPDGTALATASKDGTVKFFQVYLVGDETPRCLYSWAPHDGRPVAKIFFLDDHSIRSNADSQYWKFMITAGENMTEVKLWTCKTWECLQMLQFCGGSPSQLKMELDIAARFLIMTDVHRKLLYTMHLKHDDEHARINWVKEFIMPCNMLSFNVHLAASMNIIQMADKGYEEYIDNDVDGVSQNDEFIALEMYFVQPKSLQQGTVAFKPPSRGSRSNGHSHISFSKSISYESDGNDSSRIPVEEDNTLLEPEGTRLAGLLTTKSVAALSSLAPQVVNPSSHEREHISPSQGLKASPHPTHRTPPTVSQMSEQLSSLIGLSPAPLPQVNNVIHARARSRSRSPTILATETANDEFNIINPPLMVRTASTNGNASKTSSSSSPSREVEEILSPKNNDLIGIGSLENVIIMNAALDMDGNVTTELPNNAAKCISKTMAKNKSLPGPELMPQLPQVLEQVNSIMDMMKTQSLEIRELKMEVSRLNNVQAQVSKQVDENYITRALDKQSQVHSNRVEEMFRELMLKQSLSQPPQPQIPSNLAEILAVSIGKIVKSEIETTVLPSLINEFEPTRNNIHSEVGKLVQFAEARIKHDFMAVIQGEAFRKSLIPEVGTAVKSICEGVVSELFVSKILPRFEKSLQGTFAQVNDSFHKGTKEYITGLESVLEHERKHDNIQDFIKMQFSNMQDSLSSTLQVEVESQMLRAISSLQGGVVKQIEESMSRELSRAFKEQQRYFEISVVPRALTPAVSMDHLGLGAQAADPLTVQKQLTQMIKNGDITNAFAQAVNFGDAQVLMYLCKHVSAHKVFTTKLPTSTHLAILQQMATDILGDTETKLTYLQTAIGSLDLTDRKVLQCVARVVPVFQIAVNKYISLNPDSKLIGSIKLLEMAFCGIGGKVQSPQSAADFTQQQHPFGNI